MHPLITIDVELEINVEENVSKEIEDGENLLSEQYCMAMGCYREGYWRIGSRI
jgi:hypothetical protein